MGMKALTINEVQKFTRGLDPKEAMGIGKYMDYVYDQLKAGDVLMLDVRLPEISGPYKKGAYIRVDDGNHEEYLNTSGKKRILYTIFASKEDYDKNISVRSILFK